MTEINKKYYKNIDLIKGILVLFVILGHIILGNKNNNLLRYSIYSFHMPLFFGISGFLIKKESLLDNSYLYLFKKYYTRLLKPWIIAVIVFFILNKYIMNVDYLYSIKLNFFIPYYHLWFIPSFLLFVLLLTIFIKKKYNIFLIFIIMLLVSIISRVATYYFPFDPLKTQNVLEQIISTVQYDFRFYNFIFFYLGYFIRNNNIGFISEGFLIFINIIFWILNTYLFYNPNMYLNIGVFFILNITLLLITINLIVDDRFSNIKILSWIGKNSLLIYLYHIVGVVISKYKYGTSNVRNYYIFSFFIQIIILLFIFLINKFISYLKEMEYI